MGSPLASSELQHALADAKPILENNKPNDDAEYAAAVAYADLGKIEISAARKAVTSAKQPHCQAAARWYELSQNTLKRVQDLESASESEALGVLDSRAVSQQVATCHSALNHTSLQ
jgi:hypothetical protein